jgi:REP element-mobilizing transposase RayT
LPEIDKSNMAGTFSQIYIQVVFAVKGRESLLDKRWREELFKYMSGIVTAKNQKPIIIGGHYDHIHAFIGLKPSMALSDLVREMKNNSSNFINDRKLVPGHFSWQEGYGAFSYGHSQISDVYDYILNQEERHRKRTFREEYILFLRKYEIDHDERFLFEWLE